MPAVDRPVLTVACEEEVSKRVFLRETEQSEVAHGGGLDKRRPGVVCEDWGGVEREGQRDRIR